ncbi:uncharacterized protein MONBRDRAFT_34025 [Monosiga brevicollis MX1]|uniref:Uncharacterized protein n=1 Tax=Monosiga brevicollis TaxID=81824 RepID=A9V9G0_MONBE|nr:uncharacterized protein MONBRDRAFT_34025 [Monosiga brevicollis MX1]EDQ85790.1 predicted protein [Monosiga brevicollis MX1]|eukprot:XP_001749269.1 hypothetical protein [Monosiga brevicollis MX1]
MAAPPPMPPGSGGSRPPGPPPPTMMAMPPRPPPTSLPQQPMQPPTTQFQQMSFQPPAMPPGPPSGPPSGRTSASSASMSIPRPPTGPPTMPPTSFSSMPPSGPPSMPPTSFPSMPPSGPPTMPPTSFPSMPPSGPPSMPPMMPPPAAGAQSAPGGHPPSHSASMPMPMPPHPGNMPMPPHPGNMPMPPHPGNMPMPPTMPDPEAGGFAHSNGSDGHNGAGPPASAGLFSIPENDNPGQGSYVKSRRYPSQSYEFEKASSPSVPQMQPVPPGAQQAPIAGGAVSPSPTKLGDPRLRRLSSNALVPQGVSVNLMADRNVLPPKPAAGVKPPLSEQYERCNVSKRIMRSTLTAVPETPKLLSNARLPFALHVHPYATDPNLPVIDHLTITRCKVCRTYINPFVAFVQGGGSWRCNLCGRLNPLPQDFDYNRLTGEMIDRTSRPDLIQPSVEFIAPPEYMVRAPQPCTYIFLIDVTAAAIANGSVDLICQTILDELDHITGDARTRVAFLTFDTNIHFYNLAASLAQPQMMVMTDTEDPFLPHATDDLLVNLAESRETLLRELPRTVRSSPRGQAALGPALQAARQIIGNVGGRLSVFTTTLPSIGVGSLKMRDDASQRSGDKVHALLKTQTDFYKAYSVDASRAQLAIDVFCFNGDYADIASLNDLPRYGGGTLYHYPGFNAARPACQTQVQKDLSRYLTRPLALEAVMRLRTSKGVVMNGFHGNFFLRSQDLLALANVSPDNGYTVQLTLDDKLGETAPFVYFQAALLYTASDGTRRIRVHTMALPVVKTLHEIYAFADAEAITGLLAKLAVDRTVNSKLADARSALSNFCIDTFKSYRKDVLGSEPDGQLLTPDSLKLLPLYINALLKSSAFRSDAQVSADERAYQMSLIKTLPLNELMIAIYPRFYSLHDIAENVGVRDSRNRLPMPPQRQLSAERLVRDGIHLLYSGDGVYLYLGPHTPPELMDQFFGVQSQAELEPEYGPLPRCESDSNIRMRNIIKGLRGLISRYQVLHVITDRSPLRAKFTNMLYDDKTVQGPSYWEFLNVVQKGLQ